MSKGCVFPNTFPNQQVPLEIKWHLNASVQQGHLKGSQQPLRVLILRTFKQKMCKGPLHYTHQFKSLATLLVLPRPYNCSCPPKVVFMHCVSSRQVLPRSQDSLENVSLWQVSTWRLLCRWGRNFQSIAFFFHWLSVWEVAPALELMCQYSPICKRLSTF